MRVLLAITVLFFVACHARGDEPTEKLTPWQKAFKSISASKASDSLVLVLITNEDPFLTDTQEEQDAAAPLWCADVLAGSYRKAIETRADLDDRITLQSIAAGLPRQLTGGQSIGAVPRAVLALCDGNYRLLGLMVGVPDADDLLTLIEDGEDVAAMRQLLAERPGDLFSGLAQRSSERLSRLWRGSLEEMAVAMQGEQDNGANDAQQREQSFDSRMRLLSETFEPTYMADVRLRFGLTDASDQTRLVILEQHPQTRRPWCEAMIPFIAGSDFSGSWRSLVESIWGHQPITADADADELLAWFDLQIKTDAVVLALTPPMHLQGLPWPPVVERGSKRGVGWQEVHTLAQEHPFRTVDAQQLAVMMRSRELKAIDIRRPTRARYLLLQPKKKAPMVFRESDSPGRFAGILKRTKSSLVSK